MPLGDSHVHRRLFFLWKNEFPCKRRAAGRSHTKRFPFSLLSPNPKFPILLSRSPLYSTKAGIMDCHVVVGLSSEGDAEATSDVCSICLIKCSDPFCFTCTSKWLKRTEKCPLCMTPASSFSHNLDLPPGFRRVMSVADLRVAAEVVRLVQRRKCLPPLKKQECVTLRIRRLQSWFRALHEQMNTSYRVDHSSELASASMRLINKISMLEILKRDSTARLQLVSNIDYYLLSM
ncbi:unnamed protein product [Angiostrongylus costaricensis]|uniref:RING-type domain-containing protein n=1 Tax=Angiostrongylus costaricensis TaxID=334426 RepID=A0A0R3PJU3_ANGCS|nr:unnamed protein product [Angiostrongylus costaricensis]